MTDDIVTRLRALEEWLRNPRGENFTLHSNVFDEAADEIERLRALEDVLIGISCDCDVACYYGDVVEHCPHHVARSALNKDKTND